MLVEIKLNENKEVKAVKIKDKYYAFIFSEESIYISDEAFDSPLTASNHARRVKREQKIKSVVKNQNASVKIKKPIKITRKQRLYTEAEMAQNTLLKFREVWVILAPDKKYVQYTLTNDEVVSYCQDKDNAQTFKTYEEAIVMANTLNHVVKCGHSLRRFFVENK
jgi:hypothetical protein